jgi:IS30 family transposase
MQDRVETLLREDYSPEQVVGFLKQEGTACVSHERIYQHIWADKKRGGNLYKHLRTKGKRYRKRGAAKDKRGTICNKVSIEERPDIVEEKSRFGDLEIDTVIGKNHQGAIVTINDRATGMLKMKKIQKKEAALVKEAALELLQEWKPLIHTITSDNGKEFALHQDIAKELGIQFYFAHPYHSWERGANENLNGLIRQYIPKKTNFADISDQFIADIQDKPNNRPRKRLNFKSPNQTFLKVAFIT